jgi:RimJ/RimL family protein N-acetyltransferase
MEKATTGGGGSMSKAFFVGNRIELTPIDLEKDLEVWEGWNHDSDYLRLLDDFPASQYSAPAIKEWFEKEDSPNALFVIRTIKEQKAIGFIELAGYDWVARNAWVGVGIGDPDYRSQGYGTEAMNLLLKFAFRGQNLHRVNLGVFAFNKRAIRCYEKSGFKYEGVEREAIFKDDQRWDCHLMGILQSEWEAMQTAGQAE